ncbi:MAG: amidohydrolase family protein [Oscillospiraceae bacterium]|jgi:predicted TIM-barrel fold metal-dependent hydrolase|nr:amidohydrolase family protein [Oscillospiraceae bacterium]
MKIIDFHTHIYPDKVASRTVRELKEVAGVGAATDGTLKDTGEKMKQWGVDAYVVLNVLTNPQRQNDAIDFCAAIKSGDRLPMCSIHPRTEDPEGAVRRIKKEGLYGVKFHPDYQGFFIDDEGMLEIYALLERYALPAVFHMGFDPVSPEVIHGRPEAVKRIAGMFPRLKIVAAHLGGILCSDETLAHIAGLENVWLDTSMSEGYIEMGTAAKIIEAHGVERVLFGSDCPWHDSPAEINFVKKLRLGEKAEELIFGENAVKLLGL